MPLQDACFNSTVGAVSAGTALAVVADVLAILLAHRSRQTMEVMAQSRTLLILTCTAFASLQ